MQLHFNLHELHFFICINFLIFRNPIHVNLAMQCIANIGSKEMAEAFGYDIPKLLVSG